jgi:hypothetical protein
LIANDDDARWLRPAFAQIHRVLKRASFCVSFYAWNRIHLFMDAWRSVGFCPVGHIVFRKRYASSTRFLRYEHDAAYLLAKGDVQEPAKPISDVIEFRNTENNGAPDAEAGLGSDSDHRRILSGGWHRARPVRGFRPDTGGGLSPNRLPDPARASQTLQSQKRAIAGTQPSIGRRRRPPSGTST